MRFLSPAGSLARRLLLLGSSALCASHVAAADYGYEWIASVPGSTVQPSAMSADGHVVVGNFQTYFTPPSGPGGYVSNGFVWTDGSAVRTVQPEPGWYSISIGDVSSDGNISVGILAGGNATQAYRADAAAGQIELLGFLPGGTASRATGVSGDGNVVSGWGNSSNGNRAFRWTYDPVALSGSMQELGTLGGADSFSNGISRDGHVVVGSAKDAGGFAIAAYWVDNGPATAIGVLAGGDESGAMEANADGSVIVGQSDVASGTHAFRYLVASSTMQDLGTLGGIYSEAFGVSDDGSVVIGRSGRSDGTSSGFRWSEATGTISVDDWLRQSGVTIATDVTNDASAVSADGRIITGTLRDGKAYLARGASTDPSAPPGPPAGIITVEDYMQSFNGLPRHFFVPQQVADLAMNGANSSPMFHRLSAGQRSVWATGDLGAVRNDFGTGPTGTGEIGFAYAPTDDVTLRLALGTSYSKADLDLTGYSRVQGSYVLPEVSMAVAPNIYATLTGFASIGELSMSRAYLNGTGTDISAGEADSRTLGFRARLDWLGAFSVKDAVFTPYASFTHLTTKTDGYTETGGSFPARFDQVECSSNTVRLGLDGRLDLTTTVSLIGRAEVAHRFQDQAPHTTGEIIGFSSFDLPGAPIEQNWLRGGIGFQAKSGPLEGQLMFNVSSQEKGSYWLSASSRVIF
ncbi:autotransporter domain-containing protein [Rhizobium wuzhouense]|uniref:Autotransporter domain-containing protein n=1 Tax=Rhizobium wuzhouense TaxID=1986026 RepID=A0ABX5NVJ4_9HYPH|nr:autotransporter domain-containing protein [Rhizobium wuzhouense]PYB77207.1 hypothetical protein DMY87_02220 [Rhizobium wuzhouense]